MIDIIIISIGILTTGVTSYLSYYITHKCIERDKVNHFILRSRENFLTRNMNKGSFDNNHNIHSDNVGYHLSANY